MLLSILAQAIFSHLASGDVFEDLVNLSQFLDAIFSIALFILAFLYFQKQKNKELDVRIITGTNSDPMHTAQQVDNQGFVFTIDDSSGENDSIKVKVSWPPGFKLMPFIDSKSSKNYSVENDQAY